MIPLRQDYVRDKLGFTLIEIVVVVGILSLLMGGALASFANFRDKNTSLSEALIVADRIRKVQARASAVELPNGCIGSINFQVLMSGSDMSVRANCSGGIVIEIPELALALGSSTYSSNYDLTIDSRTGNTTSVDIDICGRNHLFRISVNQIAFVSRPVYMGTC